MILLRGKKISDSLLLKLSREILLYEKRGIHPHVDVVFVGDDPVSQNYIHQKESACQKIGISFTLHSLPTHSKTTKICELISLLSKKQHSSIIVQLPLPNHLDQWKILDAIPPSHDADGLDAVSYGKFFRGDGVFSPPTAAGIIDLLNNYHISLRKKHVVLIGAGLLVGRPLWMLIQEHGGIISTVTGEESEKSDIQQLTKQADIIISAVGKPHIITGDMLSKGCVVIDAGLSTPEGAIVGDIDFESAKHVASAITPVPGGVGPMTVAYLLKNVVQLTCG